MLAKKCKVRHSGLHLDLKQALSRSAPIWEQFQAPSGITYCDRPKIEGICVLEYMPYSAYISHMTWGVDLHPEVANWLESLSDKDYLNVMASLDALEIEGPKLSRPFVDHVKNSKHQNMKELRPPGKHFRLV